MTQQLIGQQVDRYRVERHVARGGMADVYLAHDVDLDRPVALKVMDASLARDERYLERFQREARTVAKLNHAHIVQIYATGFTAEGNPYLAMQYIPGGTLGEKLAELRESGQLMPVEQVLAITRPIADALAVAHQAGIVHRDLKPGNILLHDDGQPVLVDLGIAATRDNARLTQTGAIIGTPHYMSPEQIKGQPLDGRSDLYSLGIILYEMLAGNVPFDAPESVAVLHMQVYEPPPPLSAIRPDLMPQLHQIVARCLEKEPDARFPSAESLRSALDLASGAAIPADATMLLGTEPTPQPDFARSEAAPPVNNGRWKWLLALVPLLLIAGLFWVWRGGLIGGGNAESTAQPSAESPAIAIVDEPSPTVTLAATAAPTDEPEPTATLPPTEVPPTPTPAVQPLSGNGVMTMSSDASSENGVTLSPDQRTMLFFANRTGGMQVYSAEMPNGIWQQLTFPPGEAHHPHFSAEGDRIYYASDASGNLEIYVMDRNGSNVQQLTNSPREDNYPIPSPDGEWISFNARRGQAWGAFRMRPDGSDVQPIWDTPRDETFPMILPDGETVVLQSNANGTHGIFLVGIDGSNPRPLYDSPARDANPVASPDGEWIAFESNQTGDYEIYVIRTDGTGLQNVTNDSNSGDQLPAFSPDGQWLLYQSNSGNGYDLMRRPFQPVP